MTLSQLNADQSFIADGGLETVLVYLDGIDLPDFASFPLLDTDEGRAILAADYATYVQLVARLNRGVVLDNVVEATMSADEATRLHALQARAFADAGADMMTGVTMTYVEEAIGVTRAAVAVDVPVAVSFTVETDGRLPSGRSVGEAIAHVDNATDAAPAHYLVNCAHLSHFRSILDTEASWINRIKGVRANASTMSHAELDVASELDRGDIGDLAKWYRAMQDRLDLRVVGGCCGTDHEHIEAIANATACTTTRHRAITTGQSDRPSRRRRRS